MKSILKKQWTQITAVIAAAVCAVSAAAAGVSSSISVPMNAYALETGSEITVEIVKTEDGSYFGIDLSEATADDAGKTVYVTLTSSISKYANQGWTGMVGYWDNDAQEMVQETWTASAKSGTCKFTFEITEGMIGRNDIQLQCWYPTAAEVDSCALVVEQETPIETTTTPAETTTTVTETTTTETGEGTTTTAATTTAKEETTTTTVTTVVTGSSEQVKYTEGTQIGEDKDVQAVAEFDPKDADYAVIVYKVLSDDLNSSGGVGTWNGEWIQEDFDLPVGEDGLVTVKYNIPENVGDTVKAMVFYPSNTDVKFQSITLYYGSEPSTTVSTSTTKTTTTTSTTALEFKNISVGGHNKIDVINKGYLYVTLKGSPNASLSGAVYYDDKEIKYSGTTDENGIYTVGFKMRKGLEECDFQVQQATGSVRANFTSYWWGDASRNGKVNGSDVRAIVNYLKTTPKNVVMDGVCDYNGDGTASIADAVALTKALIALADVPGARAIY